MSLTPGVRVGAYEVADLCEKSAVRAADEQPLLVNSQEKSPLDWSRDGRYVLYQATDPKTARDVWALPLTGDRKPFPVVQTSGKWQISTAGGAQPRWRPDGQELFSVALDGRLMAVPVRVATPARTVETGTPVALFLTRLATGASIGSMSSTSSPQYAVAADGRFLVNVALDDAVTSPITIVLNWTAALRN